MNGKQPPPGPIHFGVFDVMLVRTKLYPHDFSSHLLKTIVGLLLMGGLVSLGAPFWNDILKGATAVNKRV